MESRREKWVYGLLPVLILWKLTIVYCVISAWISVSVLHGCWSSCTWRQQQELCTTSLRSANVSISTHLTTYPATPRRSIRAGTWLIFHFPVLAIVIVVPYLQVFCALLACTKPDPRFSLAELWPVRLYVLCVTAYKRCTNQDTDKSVNCPLQNGHVLIDTWLSASLELNILKLVVQKVCNIGK